MKYLLFLPTLMWVYRVAPLLRKIYNLFRGIFKFQEDKSNNEFLEILKCFRKTAKFVFFSKQIIYLESSDHPLQNDI